MTVLPEWPKNDYPDRATAEAWAKESPQLHPAVDGQRIKLAREWLHPQPCPNCVAPMPVVDAIHVEGDHFICSRCEAKLLFTVPIIQISATYWVWQLEPHQIKPDSQVSEKEVTP